LLILGSVLSINWRKVGESYSGQLCNLKLGRFVFTTP
jgi:hypothetical protein